VRSLTGSLRIDIFRASFQFYSLGLAIHFSQQFSVVLQNGGHVRMRGANRFLPNCQGAFEERLGLGVSAL
jgi:hypothetical protein